MTGPRTLVVGIGSPHGDDQAGWLVADRLSVRPCARHLVVRKAASPSEILGWLEGIDRLIVCDASRGSGPVGHWQRWVWPDDTLLNARWSGTHDLALPAVLQLAERLGKLPPEVIVWTVEAMHGQPDVAISTAVEDVLPALVQDIENELDRPESCTNNRS